MQISSFISPLDEYDANIEKSVVFDGRVVLK